MIHSRVSWMLLPVDKSIIVSAPQMVLHCSFSTSCMRRSSFGLDSACQPESLINLRAILLWLTIVAQMATQMSLLQVPRSYIEMQSGTSKYRHAVLRWACAGLACLIELWRTSSMEELTAELPMLAFTFTRNARPAERQFHSETLHSNKHCHALGCSSKSPSFHLYPPQMHPALASASKCGTKQRRMQRGSCTGLTQIDCCQGSRQPGACINHWPGIKNASAMMQGGERKAHR